MSIGNAARVDRRQARDGEVAVRRRDTRLVLRLARERAIVLDLQRVVAGDLPRRHEPVIGLEHHPLIVAFRRARVPELDVGERAEVEAVLDHVRRPVGDIDEVLDEVVHVAHHIADLGRALLAQPRSGRDGEFLRHGR